MPVGLHTPVPDNSEEQDEEEMKRNREKVSGYIPQGRRADSEGVDDLAPEAIADVQHSERVPAASAQHNTAIIA